MRWLLTVVASCIFFAVSEGGIHISHHAGGLACPLIMCPSLHGRTCPNGFALNPVTGCQMCECAPPANCGQTATCRKYCANGFQTDSNGCPICECYEPPVVSLTSLMTVARAVQSECSNVTCMIECPTGRQRDSQGCETCECLSSTSCVPPTCRNFCAFGRHRDESGCETCTCNARSPRRHRPGGRGGQTRPAAPASPGVRIGPAAAGADTPSGPVCVTCRIYCENGFKMGSDGCPLCECNDAPVASATQDCGPTCQMFCQYGFVNDPTRPGCFLCECRRQRGARPASRDRRRRGHDVTGDSAVDTQCPPMRCHRRHCAFGFAKDASTGCYTCTCATSAAATETS